MSFHHQPLSLSQFLFKHLPLVSGSIYKVLSYDYINVLYIYYHLVVPKARVLYAYVAQHPGDLELTAGTVVELTKTEGGWWEGLYNGNTGIFPANYVEKI